MYSRGIDRLLPVKNKQADMIGSNFSRASNFELKGKADKLTDILTIASYGEITALVYLARNQESKQPAFEVITGGDTFQFGKPLVKPTLRLYLSK